MLFKKLNSRVLAFTGAVMALTTTTANAGFNPVIDGVIGPDVEVVNGNVMMTMVFENLAVDGGATIPLPKYPNSSIQVGPDFQSAGTLLVLTISVEDFKLNKGKGMKKATLPGGRPLPSVAGGQLPAVAVKVKQLFNATFYVGPEVLGFFVPFKGIDLAGSILTFRFHDKADKPIGILALVGGEGKKKKNSGFLALMSVNLMGILK